MVMKISMMLCDYFIGYFNVYSLNKLNQNLKNASETKN